MLDDVLLVVVPHCSGQLVKVHPSVVFPATPPPCQLTAVDDFELEVVARPSDEILTGVIPEQLKNELPEVNGVGRSWGREKLVRIYIQVYTEN